MMKTARTMKRTGALIAAATMAALAFPAQAHAAAVACGGGVSTQNKIGRAHV